MSEIFYAVQSSPDGSREIILFGERDKSGSLKLTKSQAHQLAGMLTGSQQPTVAEALEVGPIHYFNSRQEP